MDFTDIFLGFLSNFLTIAVCGFLIWVFTPNTQRVRKYLMYDKGLGESNAITLEILSFGLGVFIISWLINITSYLPNFSSDYLTNLFACLLTLGYIIANVIVRLISTLFKIEKPHWLAGMLKDPFFINPFSFGLWSMLIILILVNWVPNMLAFIPTSSSPISAYGSWSCDSNTAMLYLINRIDVPILIYGYEIKSQSPVPRKDFPLIAQPKTHSSMILNDVTAGDLYIYTDLGNVYLRIGKCGTGFGTVSNIPK